MVRAGLTITAATALVAGLATATNAYGDYAPIAQDVVGVGGDTPQYDLQFIADGSSIAGTQGYNSTGNRYKLVTFNATPDGNARAAYANGSTQTTPIPLNATDVLREGTSPGAARAEQRRGDHRAARRHRARPRRSTSSSRAACRPRRSRPRPATLGWGYLHVVRLGTDAVQIAADNTTNAPAGLSDQPAARDLHRHGHQVEPTSAVRRAPRSSRCCRRAVRRSPRRSSPT